MKWEKYKAEVELIEKQNDVEHDLYNIIANVIRDSKAFDDISLRDIGNRRRTKSKKEKVFWGLKGFPDFVILDKEYCPEKNNVEKRKLLYGVIEAKFVDSPLYNTLDDKQQLWGHLLWFKKVIYTNGIEWRFYRIEEESVQNVLKNSTPKSLIKLQDDSYNKLAQKGIEYQDINDILNDICKKNSVDELEECKSPFVLRTISEDKKSWNEAEWNRLIDYLDNSYSVQ